MAEAKPMRLREYVICSSIGLMERMLKREKEYIAERLMTEVKHRTPACQDCEHMTVSEMENMLDHSTTYTVKCGLQGHVGDRVVCPDEANKIRGREVTGVIFDEYAELPKQEVKNDRDRPQSTPDDAW